MKQRTIFDEESAMNKCPHAIEMGFASSYGLYDCSYEGICEDKQEYNGNIYCRKELENVIRREEK